MSELSIRFVLFEPTHPGNVGAAARAIKTMGFSELLLVNPACEIDGVARARSSGALDVLMNARIVPTLADAILDRLVHNAYKLELTGESMRIKQSKWT